LNPRAGECETTPHSLAASVERNVVVGLGILIRRGKSCIDVTDPLVLLAQLRAQRLGFGSEVADRKAGPEFVASPVAAVVDTEHLVEDLQIVGMPKASREEVVEVVEPGSGDSR
jgi:hypothetical protein